MDLNVSEKMAFLLHQALWGQGEKLEQLIDRKEIEVPPFDDSGPNRVKDAAFYDLRRIEGWPSLDINHVLPIVASQFYIRDEYLEVDAFLEKAPSHVLLLGQPGIGMKFISHSETGD